MARPKKTENKKEYQINIRLTKEEMEDIEYVARSLGIGKSEAIVLTMSERADEIFRNREWREK